MMNILKKKEKEETQGNRAKTKKDKKTNKQKQNKQTKGTSLQNNKNKYQYWQDMTVVFWATCEQLNIVKNVDIPYIENRIELWILFQRFYALA